MHDIKMIARPWVRNPVDVLQCVSKQNNLHVQLRSAGDILWATCQPEEVDAFTNMARKFCLVCGPFVSAC